MGEDFRDGTLEARPETPISGDQLQRVYSMTRPGLVVVIGNWTRLTARSCHLQEIRFDTLFEPL